MRTLTSAGELDLVCSRSEDPLDKCQQAIALAKIANDPGTEVLVHYPAANSLMILGDLEQAHSQALAGLETAERLRHRLLLNVEW